MAFGRHKTTYINGPTAHLNLSNTTATVNTMLRLGRLGGFTVPTIASVSLNGGSLTVRSNLIIEGAASITVLNGLLAFTKPATLVLKDLVVDGGTISNSARA